MALFFWWASFPTIAAELNLDTRENPVSQDQSEIGIELGIFTLLGADFQLYYRLSESPWLYGYKYAKWTEENTSSISVGIPDQACHRFRSKPATHSIRKLPPIPVKPATLKRVSK